MKVNKNLAVLIVRLIIGGIFITTGWMKVSDMAATIDFFGGMSIPAFLAYIVSYAELIGGVLIVLGLWTEIATGVLAIVMLVAIYYVRSMGFQGFMGPLAVLAGLVSLLASGAGSYAVQKKS
ncbi:MAG: DoxX family protein [Patescibacteria group bacterium]